MMTPVYPAVIAYWKINDCRIGSNALRCSSVVPKRIIAALIAIPLNKKKITFPSESVKKPQPSESPFSVRLQQLGKLGLGCLSHSILFSSNLKHTTADEEK